MEKKQTAVEWLVNEMPVIDWADPYWKVKLDKAKEMEKQQIIDANMAGQMFIAATPGHYKNDAEDYYKGTFNKD
jgi:hypothetical protein